MSLVWIKVDRENGVHSAYSDGVSLRGDDIINNDTCKVMQYENAWHSVLMGVVGSTHGAAYIMGNFGRMLNTSDVFNNIVGNSNRRYGITTLFERLGKEYREKYGEEVEMDNDVVLSVDELLFKVECEPDGRWTCSETEEDFVVIGLPCEVAKALLYYDALIEPQAVLDNVSKVCTHINKHLYKIEDVPFKNSDKH